MGQSSSTALDPTDRFFASPPRMSNEIVEFAEEIVGTRDYTGGLPDDCLAYIFQFLGAGDRKQCSLVCKRWLRVEGVSRYRLSLNADNEILPFLPLIFTRFDSVTKLSLRCDRKSVSINDDAFVLISIRCQNLTRLKLRGCREITDHGMATFSQNCKTLKKLSCASCSFGAKGINSVLDHCLLLEEISVKRLRGIRDGTQLIGPRASAASSLKSICLKELVNGQSFEPLVIGAKNLRTLKIIRCLGDWDRVLHIIGNSKNTSLNEFHLERLQVTDIGLTAISKCTSIENLHIVKAPECSNTGLVCVAQNCSLLRKLHIDGWRSNRIGDEALIAVAKHCPNLQELVLIGVNATHLSLMAIACNCSKLERLALCGSGTIGDAEIACISAKCVALKKLCIKGCAISDLGMEAVAWGCPNLVKIKVKKCKGVSGEVAERLRILRRSLIVNLDAEEIDGLDASGSDGGLQESGLEVPMMGGHVNVPDVSLNTLGRLSYLKVKTGLVASRNLVAGKFRRWKNGESSSSNDNL
ncbi:F-box protein SKIP2-like [Mangifera indica]|uniref:F-box protein SKIP2-like n=1 Tax=Mangifera indica TaxID=29780 RepID=UPI001CFA0119|nr:F-box protein SKIP2-like [Mangifera indica]